MHSHTVDDVLDPVLRQIYSSSSSTHSSSVLKVPSVPKAKSCNFHFHKTMSQDLLVQVAYLCQDQDRQMAEELTYNSSRPTVVYAMYSQLLCTNNGGKPG